MIPARRCASSASLHRRGSCSERRRAHPGGACEREVCCGFGGAFSVKYPAISAAILEAKLARSSRPAPRPCSPPISAASCRSPAGLRARDRGRGAPCGRGVADMTDVPAIAAPRPGMRAAWADGFIDQDFAETAASKALADAELPARAAERQAWLHRPSARARSTSCRSSTSFAPRLAPSRTIRSAISTSISRPTKPK